MWSAAEREAQFDPEVALAAFDTPEVAIDPAALADSCAETDRCRSPDRCPAGA